MTAGLPTLSQLRDALARLVIGEPFTWQRIAGSYDLLRRALVEAVRGNEGHDPSALLDECFSLFSRPEALGQVVRFYRLDPHYTAVDVDCAWLHRNACALIATARTAVAADRHDMAALAHWASVAGELLGRPGEDRPEVLADRPTAPVGELVDGAFRSLTDAGWRVQGARIWTLAWLPRSTPPKRRSLRAGRRSRHRQVGILGGPAVRVPVAGCFEGNGFLADLCLHRLDGDGELVPHPETALQPLGTQLLGGLRAAWERSGQSVCFTFGLHDAGVPSWVPLEGTSLSGAAALGFELLRQGQFGDAGRLVIAQVAPEGTIEPVGHEVEKMQAALAGGVPSVVLAEDSPVPETCIERFRQSGQAVVRARSLEDVLALAPPRPQKTASTPRRQFVAVAAVLSLVLTGIGAIRVLTAADASQCPKYAWEASERIEVVGVWTGHEQEAFDSVLQAFCERTGIWADYNAPPDDDLAKYLDDDNRGCSPPDVAMLPQPGLMRALADRHRLHSLGDEALANLEKNYAEKFRAVGVVHGTQYGVYFKASNKSVSIYNVHVLANAQIPPPNTWQELLAAAQKLAASGMPWFALGAADGWPLSDVFENILLTSAGPGVYNQLARNEISWTRPEVVKALELLAEVLGRGRYLREPPSGLWREAALKVSQPQPQAATTVGGEFALAVAQSEAKVTPGRDVEFFEIPPVDASRRGVVGGGDVGVALTDSSGAQKLLAFLATPEAASVWARQPGFISPNHNVDPSVYPDELTERAARSFLSAEIFHFDLSDQLPPWFGASKTHGVWPLLRGFLRDFDANATAQALEADRRAPPEAPGTACPTS